MTPKQQNGRTIILLGLVTFVAVSLLILVWDATANGIVVVAIQAPRLVLIAVLFASLLRGNATSKWILVALLAMGGLIGLYTLFADATDLLGQGLLSLMYLAIAATLAASASVDSFLAYARQRAADAGAG